VAANPERARQLYTRALELYERDCGGGDARACTMVGLSAREGKGAARDAKRAVVFYRRGCDGRDGLGCKYLAEAYEQGAGVARDRARAQSILVQACTLGYTPACGRTAATPPGHSGTPEEERGARP